MLFIDHIISTKVYVIEEVEFWTMKFTVKNTCDEQWLDHTHYILVW